MPNSTLFSAVKNKEYQTLLSAIPGVTVLPVNVITINRHVKQGSVGGAECLSTGEWVGVPLPSWSEGASLAPSRVGGEAQTDQLSLKESIWRPEIF